MSIRQKKKVIIPHNNVSEFVVLVNEVRFYKYCNRKHHHSEQRLVEHETSSLVER